MSSEVKHKGEKLHARIHFNKIGVGKLSGIDRNSEIAGDAVVFCAYEASDKGGGLFGVCVFSLHFSVKRGYLG